MIDKLTKAIKGGLERTTMKCDSLQSNINVILEEKGKLYSKEQEFLDKKARYNELTGKNMKKNLSNEHSSSMSM